MPAAEDPGGGAPAPSASPPPAFFGLWPRFEDADERGPLLRDVARVFAQREAARRERTLSLS
jgi:hypothetical protein